MMTDNFIIRTKVLPEDVEVVGDIVVSTNFFYDYEVVVAKELVSEALADGESSHYKFIFVEVEGRTIGYTCYGLTPCTKSSYDIYWIAVHNDFRNKKIGRILMGKTEETINRMGGRGIYVETSSTEKYFPTREFYLRCNYLIEAQIKDFYDTGDDKVIFVKRF